MGIIGGSFIAAMFARHAAFGGCGLRPQTRRHDDATTATLCLEFDGLPTLVAPRFALQGGINWRMLLSAAQFACHAAFGGVRPSAAKATTRRRDDTTLSLEFDGLLPPDRRRPMADATTSVYNR